jgi:hypothetical protein
MLLRQRRVAAGSGLGTGLSTTITHVRPKLHHDPARATEATANDSTSPKVHRHEGYLASVQMKLVMLFS